MRAYWLATRSLENCPGDFLRFYETIPPWPHRYRMSVPTYRLGTSLLMPEAKDWRRWQSGYWQFRQTVVMGPPLVRNTVRDLLESALLAESLNGAELLQRKRIDNDAAPQV